MLFVETRGNAGQRPKKVSFTQAMLSPMASYGGLYAPETLPVFPPDFLQQHLTSDYQTLARAVLGLYELELPADVLDQALARYSGFDDPHNPAPLHRLTETVYVCELYHGPTRAFKDMALQPFGVLLNQLAEARQEHYLVLAATSGDTGPATLEAFKHSAGVKVVCLYPEGGTSDVQRLQMVTEDAPNILVIGIQGDFDDAQAALKTMLSSETFQAKLAAKKTRLSAANSVNIGRIIFQQIYHIHSYLTLVRRGVITQGDPICLNVPSGNFGNALGAYYAMRMGLPVARILIASNQNNVLSDFIRTGQYELRDRPVVGTSSPAMDILKSSNIERLLYDLFGAKRTKELMTELETQHHYQLRDDEIARLQQIFSADYATDAEVKACIQTQFAADYILDPHTATCFKVQQSAGSTDMPSVICSTAEWSKFSPTMVEALAGEADLNDQAALARVANLTNETIPPVIAELFNKPIRHTQVVQPQAIQQAVLDFL